MNDFKIKLSDIFRYVVLGAVQFALSCAVCYNTVFFTQLGNDETIGKLQFLITEPVIVIVLAISVFYLSGYLTQMALKLFCKGNFMGTGLGEMVRFIKVFPSFPVLNRSLLNHTKYPHWLYFSQRPDKLLGIYREIMDMGNDSDVKTEYLFANNLFQGIALSLVVFAIFAINDLTMLTRIIVTIVMLSVLCLLGYLSTEHKFAIILNKLSGIVIPFTIVLCYYEKDQALLGGVVAGGVVLCLCIAGQLTRLHIRRVDTLVKYGDEGKNETRFIQTLKRVGVPRAIVLTRVSDSVYEYYEEQLKSIKSQIYPNVKVIALIDCESKRYGGIVQLIENYHREGLDISHYKSVGSGAASLAYEIRDIFLNYADPDDVAITLDGDDLFADNYVISRIMGRMAYTRANICLLTFELFGDLQLNYSKSYPNEIVRNIAKNETSKGKALYAAELIKYNAYLISTLGWIKCYKKDVLSRYQSLCRKYKDDFNEYTKYEDFPDIVALLDKNSRVCAVATPAVLFRKRGGSVTTVVGKDNYDKYIPYFLRLARLLSEESDSIELKAQKLIKEKFIPYKFVQYLNIVRKKTSGKNREIENYSCCEFYERFVQYVYEGDRETFNNGIICILKESYNLSCQHHTGYYGNDLPSAIEEKKDKISFNDIKDAYELNPIMI